MTTPLARGLWGVLATPFDDRLDVDRVSLRNEVASFVNDGCGGLVTLGVFGEAASSQPAEAYGPLENLRVATIHNGAVHREDTVSGMTFSPAELLSFRSQVMPFYPGDILSTGTPGAVGIAPGDVVRCELGIDLASLTNPVS